MNKKMLHTFCIVVSILILALTAVGVPAKEYILGDLGRPGDYDQTMKLFRDTVADFSSFAEQLPTQFNWKTQGKVTPAKDQGNCGSCWAFASAGAFESKLLMKGKPVYDLSEQQQVSCNISMSGCGGGSSTALRFWETVGPMQESCTGYPSTDGSEPDCSTLSGCATLPFKTMDYYTVDTSSTDEVKTSLYTDGPTYFRFDVYSDFQTWWNSAASGDVYTQSSGSFQGGHAILLIGWNDSKGAWLFKNSWGETDGPNGDGTFWMAYSGHAQDLRFGMANVHIKEDKPPLKQKKLMFLRKNPSTGVFSVQVFAPPTTLGATLGPVLASDNHIGKNVCGVAAGNYRVTTGDELVVMTKHTATTPNGLYFYKMPTCPNGNTGSAFVSDPGIGKYQKYVTSGDFNGDGKEEIAVARINPTTKVYELYIYKKPKAVGGNATLIASVKNLGKNIMGIAAGNFNTKVKDELFVISGNSAKAGLYVYRAPSTINGNIGNPIASDTNIGAGIIPQGLAVGNFDSDDSNLELALLRKKSTGELTLRIVRPPAGVNGEVGELLASAPGLDTKIVGVAAADCPGSGSGFTEDFNDGVAQNWVDDQSGTWSVGGGVYKMTGTSPASSTTRYSYYNQDFDDYTYQVDVLRVEGSSSSSLGLMFRSDTSFTNGYVFHIDGTGYYLIYKLIGGTSTWLIPAWTYSSAINAGFNVWNTLKVVCNGSTLEFYANGTKLETITDSSLTTGKVVVKAYDVYYDINIKHFDNAELTSSSALSAEVSTEESRPAVSIPASLEASEEHR